MSTNLEQIYDRLIATWDRLLTDPAEDPSKLRDEHFLFFEHEGDFSKVYTEEELQRFKDEAALPSASLADMCAPFNKDFARVKLELEEQLRRPRLRSYGESYFANNRNLFVGVVPNYDLNATVMRIADGEHLVLLNLGLTHTVYTLAKLCTSQMRTSRDIPLREWKPEPPMELLRAYLKRYFEFYITTGAITPERSVAPKESQIAALARITRYAEMFAVAHEMGHVIEGHLRPGRLTKRTLLQETFDVYEGSFDKELVADRIGVEIVFSLFPPEEGIDSFDLRAAIAGVNLFFRTADFMEKLLGFNSRTHPPASERRYEFLDVIYKRYSHRNLSFSNSIDHLIEHELLKDFFDVWRKKDASD